MYDTLAATPSVLMPVLLLCLLPLGLLLLCTLLSSEQLAESACSLFNLLSCELPSACCAEVPASWLEVAAVLVAAARTSAVTATWP